MNNRWRTRLLWIDGGFLMLAGLGGLLTDLAGYFAEQGPNGAYMFHHSYAVGYVEAHGLATLMGILMIVHAHAVNIRFWNGLAAAVHILLGISNLVFWAVFVEVNAVPLGVVVTVIHWLLVIGQLAAVATNSKSVHSLTEVVNV